MLFSVRPTRIRTLTEMFTYKTLGVWSCGYSPRHVVNIAEITGIILHCHRERLLWYLQIYLLFKRTRWKNNLPLLIKQELKWHILCKQNPASFIRFQYAILKICVTGDLDIVLSREFILWKNYQTSLIKFPFKYFSIQKDTIVWIRGSKKCIPFAAIRAILIVRLVTAAWQHYSRKWTWIYSFPQDRCRCAGDMKTYNFFNDFWNHTIQKIKHYTINFTSCDPLYCPTIFWKCLDAKTATWKKCTNYAIHFCVTYLKN